LAKVKENKLEVDKRIIKIVSGSNVYVFLNL